MAIEQTVLLFRGYARQVLDEQSEYLKAYNKNYLLSGKLARLKFFNAHLKILKQKLSKEIESILSDNISSIDYAKLKSALNLVSLEYINEYLYIGFSKDENRSEEDS